MPALPKQSKPVPYPAYIAWLHEKPCIVTGRLGVHAHHLLSLGHGKITKNDRYAVPLAPDYHQFTNYSVHGMGCERKWEALHGVDLIAEAERHWEEYNG